MNEYEWIDQALMDSYERSCMIEEDSDNEEFYDEYDEDELLD
jgi:hypothetical protein